MGGGSGPEIGNGNNQSGYVTYMTKKEVKAVEEMMFESSAYGLQGVLGFDDKRLIGMYYVVLRKGKEPRIDDRILIGNNPSDVRRNILTSRIKYRMKSKIYQVEAPYESI